MNSIKKLIIPCKLYLLEIKKPCSMNGFLKLINEKPSGQNYKIMDDLLNREVFVVKDIEKGFPLYRINKDRLIEVIEEDKIYILFHNVASKSSLFHIPK